MLYSTLLLVTAALIFLKTVRSDISLSPKTWPPNEFDRMERMTLNRFERPKPLAVSNCPYVKSIIMKTLKQGS